MQRSLATVLATSLLGLIAAGALVGGSLFFLGSWITRDFEAAATAAALLGLLTVAFGVLAGLASRDVWQMRPRGLVLGLITVGVAILAPAIAILEDRSSQVDELLYLAIALATATFIALVAGARGVTNAAADAPR